MSEHGRSSLADAARAADVLNPKWVVRHRGCREEFLLRCRRLLARTAALGREALERLAPSLLYLISDERTLRAAWDYLQEYGGQAPGPDGCRYDDFPESVKWEECRALRDEIRRGEYEPGPERIHRISKGPGRGWRPLVLQCVRDRVVQRAAVEVLQPLLDPHFDRRSFGFRPGRSALHALELAQHLFVRRGRRVWVTADLRDAFLRVPLRRLMDVVRKRLPADDLADFIARATGNAATPGLRQGGPLSPLLLNLFLDHFLDRPWRKRRPDVPLIRYAHDILLPCRSAREARAALADLGDLLRPTGMLLKDDSGAVVRTLKPGGAAEWMGFRIDRGPNGLRFGLGEGAWRGLAENLALAHEAPNSPVRAVQSICGWVSQKGPCYHSVDHDRVYARIAALAREQAFDEIPDRDEVRHVWQRAYARWCKLCSRRAMSGAGA